MSDQPANPKSTTEGDLLLDLYFYEKEYEAATLKEDKEAVMEKIKEAHRLLCENKELD